MNKHYEADKAISKEMAEQFGEGWMPPLPAIEITKPVAMPGDEVVFNNYRARRNSSQAGKVIHVETNWRSTTEYQHCYTIRPEGKNYTVCVTDVRPINQFI